MTGGILGNNTKNDKEAWTTLGKGVFLFSISKPVTRRQVYNFRDENINYYNNANKSGIR